MPSNKDGHQAKNVDVKLDVKAHRTRKTCCITKTSNNKELVRRKSHGTSLKKKKKERERERERKREIFNFKH